MRVNLPNSDMVGHTGDIEATVVACKAADEAVKVYPLFNPHQEYPGWMVLHFILVYVKCLEKQNSC